MQANGRLVQGRGDLFEEARELAVARAFENRAALLPHSFPYATTENRDKPQTLE